jgi:predicted nucleic acid-binding protein
VREAWVRLLEADDSLATTSYVLIETCAVVQRRLGMVALRTVIEDIQPLFAVHWVDSTEHDAGVAVVLAMGRRKLSLVDCVSFQVMRQRSIFCALTLDPHFAEQGFQCLPEIP